MSPLAAMGTLSVLVNTMGVSSSKPHPVETKWFPDFEASLPSLEGKTVAITGTTSGTGYIVARTAIRKNADNVLLLNRPSERAKKAEEDLKKYQGLEQQIKDAEEKLKKVKDQIKQAEQNQNNSKSVGCNRGDR